MADFFVLISGKDDPIYRIQLERPIQKQLSNDFQRGADLLKGRLDFFEPGRQSFNPDETEAWRIPNMHLPPSCHDAFQNPIGTPTLKPKELIDLNLRALVAVFGKAPKRWAAFQVIDSRNLLLPDRMALVFSTEVFTRLKEPGLLIGDEVHAVLDEEGAFIFEKLFWARRLFDMSIYFEEATDEEVNYFLDHENVYVDDRDDLRAQLSAWARKRISIVLRSGILDSESPESIKRKADNFRIGISLRKGKLVIPRDAGALKQVLKFLEEDYYRGPLSGTPFVANSKTNAKMDR